MSNGRNVASSNAGRGLPVPFGGGVHRSAGGVVTAPGLLFRRIKRELT
jgi:hypothetical protein